MALKHIRKSITVALSALAKSRYSLPLFVFREALSAFQRDKGFSISAALSFYAMFALIPMVLLIFFLLSHFAVSSHYALAELTSLVNNLVPQYSHRVMTEVYNIAKHKVVWGAFGLIALFWAATPLAGALRSAFFTIAQIAEQPSYLKRKLEDMLGVIGILALFFLFSSSGLILKKIIHLIDGLPWFASTIDWLMSIVITTLSIALFYRTFSPTSTRWQHILIGSFITSLLWAAMRPTFSLFLLANHSYGIIFGGMKNLFLSIGWLYYCFAALILGIETMVVLQKRAALMLQGLFLQSPPDIVQYHKKLASLFGHRYKKNDVLFKAGDIDNKLYYILNGEVEVRHSDKPSRKLKSDSYFGEKDFLAETPRTSKAIVTSDQASIIAIAPETLETLMLQEPKIAIGFLREMASRL